MEVRAVINIRIVLFGSRATRKCTRFLYLVLKGELPVVYCVLCTRFLFIFNFFFFNILLRTRGRGRGRPRGVSYLGYPPDSPELQAITYG